MLVWPAYRDAFWLTADADNVYVRIAPKDLNHGVYRCAANGCGGVATPVLTPDIIPVAVAKLANDATAIYWSTYSDTPGERGVRRLAKQP
jgi:hypothetical protein